MDGYLNAQLFDLQQEIGRWFGGIAGFFGTKQFLLVLAVVIGLAVAFLIILGIRSAVANAIDNHFSRLNDELDRN